MPWKKRQRLLPRPALQGPGLSAIITTGLRAPSAQAMAQDDPAMSRLKKFLVELPLALGKYDADVVRANVFKALYYAATDEARHMDLLFKPHPDLATLDNYAWPLEPQSRKHFYDYVSKTKYSHPPDRICGRALGKAEPVYRCDDCGYDDTCCLCIHCFNKQDHVDHNISVYISGGNGGLCDCGDDAAFSKKLNCLCLLQPGLAEPLPAAFSAALANTLTVVLDYILDVTNFSLDTLPFVHRHLNSDGPLKITLQHLSDLGLLLADAYGTVDENSDAWYLVLWNDEHHDFVQAESAIRSALGCSVARAKSIAHEINQHGRAIIREALLYSDLLVHQRRAEVDGLVATIATSRDYLRECIVLHMFEWIHKIVSFEGFTAFREESKRLLGEILLQPDHKVSKDVPAEFFRSASLDLERASFESGMLCNGELLNLIPTRVKPDPAVPSLSDSVHSILYRDSHLSLTMSRIQILLAFEIRFVLEIRRKLVTVILPNLLTDPKTKAIFTEQYIEIYPALLWILALSDREEQLSTSADISVQLFTCPKTNMWVLESGNLPKILAPLCMLIEDHSSRPNESGFANLIDLVTDYRSKHLKSSIQKTIQTAVESVHRIITKNNSSNILDRLLDDDILLLFLNFLKFFQGIFPVTRKYGDHVEHENLTEFYSFILKSLPVLNMVKCVSHAPKISQVRAKAAVKVLMKFLKSRKIEFKQPGIARFQVSKDRISHLNPLNSFLSFLIQRVGSDEVCHELCDSESEFIRISDFSLRSIVLANQVTIGFWIRNGATLRRQAEYMMEIMPGVSFHRDFHLNQIALLADNSDTSLLNFLDRWELLSWYMGETSHSETIYEHRFSYICERFLLFVYNLLTDRHCFVESDSEVMKDDITRYSICYALCEKPRPYTKLRKVLPLEASKISNFDEILKECADYQPPTGLYDFGMYRLKPEWCERLDPLSHMDCGTSRPVFEALRTDIAKTRGVEASKVILNPVFYHCASSYVEQNIGSFTRTTSFAKLIYKLLQVAIETEEEEYLPNLLHLIHAVIVDSTNIVGRENSVKHLVSIPVCDLLLTLAESGMSPSIVLKAEFLLNEFIARDDGVMASLVDCFGANHIENFKNKRTESNQSKRQRSIDKALRRKMKLMEKFAKQREIFMANNNMEDASESNEDTSDPFTRVCVSCGERESLTEPLCMFATKVDSTVFRKIPKGNKTWFDMAFANFSRTIDTPEGKVYSEGFPSKATTRETVMFSCSHFLHLNCAVPHSITGIMTCPLCHNINNETLPSFMSPKARSFIERKYLYPTSIGSTQHKVISVIYDAERQRDLLESTFHPEYFDSHGNIHGVLSRYVERRYFKAASVSKVDALHTLRQQTTLIANAIAANEVASRVDGDSAIRSFFDDIPASLKSMVRSMIQIRILLANSSDFKKLMISSRDGADDGKDIYLDFNGTDASTNSFLEVVRLFFDSLENLSDIVAYSLVKLLARTIFALEHHYAEDVTHSTFVPVDTSQEQVGIISRLIELMGEDKIRNLPSTTHAAIYCVLERSAFTFLRQCALFLDILTCEYIDENEFRSQQIFDIYRLDVDKQESPYDSSALFKMFGFATFTEFLESICQPNNDGLTNFRNAYDSASRHSRAGHEMLIDFHNAPRLVRLPRDSNAAITDPDLEVSAESVCLHCGGFVSHARLIQHSETCGFMGLFFCPDGNAIHTVLEAARAVRLLKIAGPYMTIHGEVKLKTVPGKAIINDLRYNHLNKLWATQGLYGFVTRSVFSEVLGPGEDLAGMEVEGEFEGESEDEFDVWE